MPKIRDLAGIKFGRLTVIESTEKRISGSIVWKCKCECGNFIDVRSNALVTGNTASCGCLNKVGSRKRHGATQLHGKSHPLYTMWSNIKARCNRTTHPNYQDYGGRGIKMCIEWEQSYERFRDYVLVLENCPSNTQEFGSRLNLSLDRIRNNEGYKPGNVRWGNQTIQQNNKRNNRCYVVNGEKMTLAQIVRKFGKAPYQIVYSRLRNGWTLKEAVLTLHE